MTLKHKPHPSGSAHHVGPAYYRALAARREEINAAQTALDARHNERLRDLIFLHPTKGFDSWKKEKEEKLDG